MLILKGRILLVEADALKPEQVWPWLAVVAGLFLGGLQAKFLFPEAAKRIWTE